MSDFVAKQWEPISDLPENWATTLRNPQTEALNLAWQEQAEELRQQGMYHAFLAKLKRQWSVETGVIEGLYSITEGATRILIEKGLDSSFIASSETDDEPANVIEKIKDHHNAIEGLYAFVSGNRPLGTSYIKELHVVLTANQLTYEARDTLGNWCTRLLPRGLWKIVTNDVEHHDGAKFEFAPPEHVAQEMDRLIELHHEHHQKGVPADVEAAWLHHRFSIIHPFTDGNGRVARCLATLVFLKSKWLPLVVTRSDRDGYIAALRHADNGDLKPLVDLFGSLQRKSIREAFSLSEAVITDAREFTGILQAVRARFAERRRAEQDRRNRAIHTADSLFVLVKNSLHQRAIEITDAIRDEGDGFKAFMANGEKESERSKYYYKQIVETAQSYEYFANLDVYQAWVSLVLLTTRRAEILFSFHGIGRQSSGVLGCTAMFFTKDKTEDGETEIAGLTPLGGEPFEFTYTEDDADVRRRFTIWLDRMALLGMQEWQKVI
jgi:Fic family protein